MAAWRRSAHSGRAQSAGRVQRGAVLEIAKRGSVVGPRPKTHPVSCDETRCHALKCHRYAAAKVRRNVLSGLSQLPGFPASPARRLSGGWPPPPATAPHTAMPMHSSHRPRRAGHRGSICQRPAALRRKATAAGGRDTPLHGPERKLVSALPLPRRTAGCDDGPRGSRRIRGV